MTGVKMLFGRQATVDSIGIHTLETQEDTEKISRDLGAGMRDFLADKAR